MIRSASISKCGRYRWTLTRRWDDRPMLLVVMFNPSTADGHLDDQTISLLCHVASHNGYGGIVVVNLVPLRSSKPDAVFDMLKSIESGVACDDRDALWQNDSVIQEEVEKAGAIMFAWGALADRCSWLADFTADNIEGWAETRSVPIYCLGKTSAGYPLHPMARGKRKVPKDAKLVPWPVAA